MTPDSEFRYWRTLDPKLRSRVQELRHDPTPCEQTVWLAIRGRAIEGVKFRRQHPFEHFILDFFAPEIKLAIEIDGDVHDDPVRKRYDAWREGILKERGLRVLRFSNEEVALDVQGVIDRIRVNIYALKEQR